MKILIVLPPSPLSTACVQRTIASVRLYFGEQADIHFGLAPGLPAPSLPDSKPACVHLSDCMRWSDYSVLVRYVGDRGEAQALPKKHGVRSVYSIGWTGRLLQDRRVLEAVDDPWLDRHVFNRLSRGLYEGFHYFPYGYLFRHTGLGPTNEFGHRATQQPEELERRSENLKVITVFGGSAAWSLYCLPHEMFATQLQVKLNAYCEEQDFPSRFVVLNYAQHGNVVLNEIITYLLLCWRFRPDVVIAHDGFNDMAYGQISDTHLLNKHSIVYQNNLEEWAQILHESKDVALDWQCELEAPVKNSPRMIIRSYMARLSQFRAIVEAHGSVFLSGLQPCAFGKKSMSPEESQAVAIRASGHTQAEVYRKLPFVYEKCIKVMTGAGLPHWINIHGLFGAFTDADTHFGDIVHTVPLGDAAVADCYFQYIRDHVLDTLHRKNRGGL